MSSYQYRCGFVANIGAGAMNIVSAILLVLGHFWCVLKLLTFL